MRERNRDVQRIGGSVGSNQLNENQARRLRIYLGQLVAEALDLEESLSGLPDPPAAWVRPVRADIEDLIHAARRVATELELDIEQKAHDPERQVAAWAGVWWARALDCRPSALRGYGPVDPDLDRSLGPAIEEIADILHGIRSQAETSAEEESHPGQPSTLR